MKFLASTFGDLTNKFMQIAFESGTSSTDGPIHVGGSSILAYDPASAYDLTPALSQEILTFLAVGLFVVLLYLTYKWLPWKG